MPSWAAAAWRLLACRATLLRRLVAEHAWVLFVLAPIVVGAVTWVVYRYLSLLRSALAGSVEAADPLRLASGLGLLFALALWPGGLTDLYGRSHGGEDLVDSLPVPERARAAAVLAQAALRGLVPALVFTVALLAVIGGAHPPAGVSAADVGPPPLPGVGGGLWLASAWGAAVLAMFHLAALDLLLAAVLVRCGLGGARSLAAVGAAGAIALVVPWAPARALLAPWWLAGEPLRRSLASAAGVEETADAGALLHLAAAAAVTAMLVVLLSIRFRRTDLESGRALGRFRPRTWKRLEAPAAAAASGLAWLRRIDLAARLDPPVRAQVRRDLRLVARRFSPAVHVSFGVALLAVGAALLLAADAGIEDLVRRRILVSGFAVSVLATISVLPFLLKHQLPIFWIEKSSGVERSVLWRSKVVTSSALALVPVLACLPILAFLAPGSPGEVVLACLQLLAAALVMAPLLGLTSFEMAGEPMVSLLYGSFLGLAVAALFVFYAQGWWLWICLGAYLGSHLVARAERRLLFLEVER
ncbi:MAG: hypothetical protein MI919_41575 [Holophagales bacterium]|nr:hypothetical protein [Holophagales bacterium]